MKTITSVELAKLAGVSQSTVSRCLNDSPLVSEETKARVKKLAEEYSFQFNTNARGLKTNRTGVIGYVFSAVKIHLNPRYTKQRLGQLEQLGLIEQTNGWYQKA